MNSEQRPYSAHNSMPQDILELPGDVGALAQYIFSFARYPEPNIAIAGAISLYSGFVGKAFNAPGGAGLNTYTLFLAPTGVGKNIVKEARGRLFLEIAKSVPAIEDFKGPGDLGSAAGGTRWLEKRPCCLSIFGEFGPVLKKITSPRANANDEGTQRFILDCYSNSGLGSTIDPIAYSDRDKNTATIHGASFSIFAESVPERIYESFHEGLISSGLLPRFDVWESNNPRPYINRNRVTEPPAVLVDKLANLAAYCLTEASQGRVNVPTFGPGAEDRLFAFEAWTTDQINASGEVARQLWNRAFLKALKLASLRAVGINHIQPVITLAEVEWAGNLVARQTANLIARVNSGDIGEEAGNQNRQVDEVIRVIREYVTRPWPECKKYHGDEAFHAHGVITFAHIQQRLSATAAFRKDRLGAQAALERTVKSLLSAFVIREVPPKQMADTYGKAPRAFCVSDPNTILNGFRPRGFNAV